MAIERIKFPSGTRVEKDGEFLEVEDEKNYFEPLIVGTHRIKTEFGYEGEITVFPDGTGQIKTIEDPDNCIAGVAGRSDITGDFIVLRAQHQIDLKSEGDVFVLLGQNMLEKNFLLFELVTYVPGENPMHPWMVELEVMARKVLL